MDPSEREDIVETPAEDARIESLLRDLWERLRASAQQMHDLRQDRQQQADKLAFLEQELENHKVALQKKETEIRQLRAEHLQLVNSSGKNAFTEEEKEYLKGRIRDLIVKINSYL